MKSIFIFIAMITSLNSFADWKCLDSLPQNEAARKSLLRKTSIELRTAKDMEEIYKELAVDAKTTRDLSIASAAVGASPLALPAGLAIAGTISQAAVMAGLGWFAEYSLGFITIFAPLAADIAIGLESGAALLQGNNNFDGLAVRKYQAEFEKASQVECSYDRAFAELERARNEVLDEKFDGSRKNMILDHITLGQLSKNATTKLYSLSVINRLLLEKKIQDLEELGREM